jgi:hypothetical protein
MVSIFALRVASIMKCRSVGNDPAYMIGELNAAFGCDATLTFDKAAAKNGAFRHLPA